MLRQSDLTGKAGPNDRDWYKEFGLKARFPRPPLEAIKELFDSTQEPHVFLRPHTQYVDITVRMSIPSDVFPLEMKKELATFGVTLPKAFENVLWHKLEARGNKAWHEFVKVAVKAHRRTWLHLFELAYLGHFHPDADKWLKIIKSKVTPEEKMSRSGPLKMPLAESDSLRIRYVWLLAKCRLIHREAKQATASINTGDSKFKEKVRRQIWERVRKSIHGMPGDGYIFDGPAFTKIPYGKPRLHIPGSWKPHQLAISLLSFERMVAYQTIEKKLALAKASS